jgi:hypothetical protein
LVSKRFGSSEFVLEEYVIQFGGIGEAREVDSLRPLSGASRIATGVVR